MHYNEYFEKVKKGEIAPLYIFAGGEGYIKRKAVEFLANSLNIPKSNIKSYFGDEVDVERIIHSSSTTDMFGQGGGASLTVIKRGESLKEKLVNVIRDGNWSKDNILIIFVDLSAREIKKKKIFKKELNKVEIVEFTFPSKEEFFKWLKKELRLRGIKTDAKTLQYLLENLPPSLERVSRELDKLMLFSEGELDLFHIEETLVKDEEAVLFKWIDQIIEKNKKELMEELDRFFQKKKDTHEVYYYLAKTLRNLYLIKLSKELAIELIEDSRRRRMLEKTAKKLKEDEIKEKMDIILDALMGLRSGKSPKLLLFKTVAELAK